MQQQAYDQMLKIQHSSKPCNYRIILWGWPKKYKALSVSKQTDKDSVLKSLVFLVLPSGYETSRDTSLPLVQSVFAGLLNITGMTVLNQ